jgi:hypothetical protein
MLEELRKPDKVQKMQQMVEELDLQNLASQVMNKLDKELSHIFADMSECHETFETKFSKIIKVEFKIYQRC